MARSEYEGLPLDDEINQLISDIAVLKSDIADLETTIATLKSDLETTIATLQSDLETTIATLQSDLETTIATLQSDIETDLRRGAVYAASDVLVTSSDYAGSTKSTTMQKERTIYIPKDVFKGLGSTATKFRIKFDIKTESAGIVASGQIYKNGVAVGSLKTNNTETYVTKSQDLDDWGGGDTIELWTKTGNSSWNCYIRNFRIYGDETLLHQADIPKWS